jgi:ABC-type spermidine/putrescine transport system permease subunit I
MPARGDRGALARWYAAVFSARAVVWAFALVWVGLVVFPLGLLVVYSFLKVQYFQMVWEPSLDTWRALFDSGRWLTAVRTLRIALTVTVIELLIAYPFALWLAKGCRSQRVKAVVLALLTIPFFLDLSSRTIVFRPVLGENGLINTVLLDWGLIDAPVSWLLLASSRCTWACSRPTSRPWCCRSSW